MKKIEFSAEEISVIQQQLNEEIEVWTATPEQQKLLTAVIEKAEAVLDEEDAYDELEAQGNDLIRWIWDKYQKQESTPANA